MISALFCGYKNPDWPDRKTFVLVRSFLWKKLTIFRKFHQKRQNFVFWSSRRALVTLFLSKEKSCSGPEVGPAHFFQTSLLLYNWFFKQFWWRIILLSKCCLGFLHQKHKNICLYLGDNFFCLENRNFLHFFALISVIQFQSYRGKGKALTLTQ